MARSKANRTVGDDMLPKSRNTPYETLRSSRDNPSAFCTVLRILLLPGWNTKPSNSPRFMPFAARKPPQGRAEMGGEQCGEIRTEYHTKTVIFDVPAHDVLGLAASATGVRDELLLIG